MNRLAVLGHPISHSRSPEIHQQFAQQFGYTIDYQKIDVSPGGLGDQIAGLVRAKALGCNITVPYKSEVMALCDDMSPEARALGVINTLKFSESGLITGHNTDAAGFIADLIVHHNIPVSGKRVLLVGAGGAAQGVASALAQEAPEGVHIWNRTSNRAKVLADRVGDALVTAKMTSELRSGYDVIINASAAGLSNQAPDLPTTLIGPHTRCYDLSYNIGGTPFLAWAHRQGAAICVDGLGMLIEQAAFAFQIWFGVLPQTAPVRSRFNLTSSVN